ncbi:MAG: CBS domain-containing protein [Desulfopila sp.]|jgi:acetoin utilization protein AcuB|nr:CBS domain-containing protein [Desulfopila sp.]
MFYIYDVDGLRFRGPMEALEQIRRVEKSKAVRALKENEEQSGLPFGPGAQAARAYQKVLNRENLVEPLLHTYQIMSSPVSTINGNITLYEAWSMLKNSNIRQLVITSNTNKVQGILSDRDILKHIVVTDDQIDVNRNLLVADIMKTETLTTDSLSDIRRVARVMAFYHIDAMPVVEKEYLAGIVTRGDILRGFAENPKLNLWA